MKTYNLSSKNALSTNSSGGKLLKWKDGNTFIKTSTVDTSSLQLRFMYESYSEVICYHIAKLLGIDCVEYKLCRVVIDNRITTIACESQDFTLRNNRKYSYKSIARLMLDSCMPRYEMYDPLLYEKILTYFGNSTAYKEYLDNNILLDVLTLNDDRHFGNFGILVSDSNIEIPPLFDNGNSLFSYKHIETLDYTDDLMSYLRCKPFDTSFNGEAERLRIRNKYDLNKLYKNISSLVRYMIDNQELPEQRGRFILDLLKSRIKYLTKLR